MDVNVFDKGAKLWKQRRVVLEDETEIMRYYAVWGEHGEYKVRLSSDKTFNCTCPFGSLKGGAKGAMCSHVVSVVLHAALGDAPPPPAPAELEEE